MRMACTRCAPKKEETQTWQTAFFKVYIPVDMCAGIQTAFSRIVKEEGVISVQLKSILTLRPNGQLYLCGVTGPHTKCCYSSHTLNYFCLNTEA